jgi:hypothetical protein
MIRYLDGREGCLHGRVPWTPLDTANAEQCSFVYCKHYLKEINLDVYGRILLEWILIIIIIIIIIIMSIVPLGT